MATRRNRILNAQRKGKKAQDILKIEERLKDPNLDPDVRKTLEELMAEYEHSLKSKMGNKIVKHDGEVFHSKLELYMHKQLEAEGIRAARQVTVTLMEGFKLYGEAVRPIPIIVDFVVEGFVFIDVKGDKTDKFKMKWKLLKNKYMDKYEYHLPRSVKQIDELILYLKQRTNPTE